jgi:hypothetical protein
MITTFKFCAQAIFILLEKTHPPWFTKFEFKKFFSLFYIISTQRSYIYKRPDTNRRFAKLRAISNLFSFFLYTLYNREGKGFNKFWLYIGHSLFLLSLTIAEVSASSEESDCSYKSNPTRGIGLEFMTNIVGTPGS